MQRTQLLAKMSSRSVLCGALFGLAFMPVANAQRSQAGPSDATSLAYSSSSSLPEDPGSAIDGQAPTLGGPTQTQPPTPTYGGGQRRYGHQTYGDRWTNADGSSKYALSFGGGMTIPLSPKTNTKTPGVQPSGGTCAQNNSQLGAQGQYFNSGGSPCVPDNTLVQTPDWAIQIGLGRNFNKRFGVLGQFEYDRMNVAASIINYIINTNSTSSTSASGGLAGMDMNTHVISLTLNPMFNFYQTDTWGAYVIGGGGYYHKVTNFTITVSGGYGGYGYGGGYASPQNIATVAGNAGGLDLGFGVTRKFSTYSNAKLFLEARYNYINSLSNANSAYPENSHSTGYIPVVLGVRW